MNGALVNAPKVRFPLGLKLGAALCLVGIAPLAIVGAVVLDVNRRALEEVVLDEQGATLDDVSAAVESTLRESEDALEAVGRALTDPALDPADPAQALAIEHLAASLVEGRSVIDHAAVYDRDGALVDVLREEAAAGIVLPEVLPEALRREASERGAATGPPHTIDGERRLLEVVPLTVDEAITGFVAAEVSLSPVAERTTRQAELRFPGVPDAVAIVDLDGNVLARSSSSADGPLPAALLRGIDLGASAGFAGPYVDAEGVERIATVQPIGNRRLRAIAQEPTSIAYSSLAQVRLWVGGTIVGAMLAAILVGLWLARHITGPLASLVAFTRELAQRRFSARVQIGTSDELAVLGRSLSDAAASLEESEVRIRKEESIRGDLGRYLPKEIVDRVVAREQDMKLGGARRTISVLFADVVAFTPLTEKLPPEKSVAILNELFTILTEIVFRHGGTVDKFVGDSVMALFGAPADQEDHAARAVATAEDMLRWLETGNVAWRETYGITIQLAIGIHTGECVVGNIGSESRMEYTAIGDVVNVAARLEAVARPQQILLTNATREAAGDDWDYHDLGERELAGRKAKIHVFELGS